MDAALDRLAVRHHFAAVHFVTAKSIDLFNHYIAEGDPESTLVVGDRAQGEIALAKSLGARAIWLRAGKFSDELPLRDVPPPDETIYTIGSLLDSSLVKPQA